MITADSPDASKMKLFWACFIALVATSFVFGVRAATLGDLQGALGLSEQEKGAINGAGMWPFALSIIFFSLVIDRIGYKTVALFAIACHAVSLYFHLRSSTYKDFYLSTLLVSLANGSVESFINPVVATLFPKQKSKWLNILHAGWPAGMALGALMCALLPDTRAFFASNWQFRFGMCLLPVLIYAILVIPCRFPINERVAAGVSYREMLSVFGAGGFFLFFSMFTMAIFQSRSQEINWLVVLAVGGAFALAAGIYTRSLGHWLFLVVLLTIGPLATTELGTDGWMPELLKFGGPEGVPNFAVWVFVYTSVIMTILRFYAGPIVHSFSPIGLLVVSAAVAIGGLLFFSVATGWAIVAAATVYAFGKAFLWSTTLGLTAEQLPKGGALALNGVSAVGVLFLGVLGAPYFGYKQDLNLAERLSAPEHQALYDQVKGPEKPSIFGDTPSLDQQKVSALAATPAAQKQLDDVQALNKRGMFRTIVILPAFMLVCYILLWLYFKARGGYKPVSLSHADEAEPGF